MNNINIKLSILIASHMKFTPNSTQYIEKYLKEPQKIKQCNKVNKVYYDELKLQSMKLLEKVMKLSMRIVTLRAVTLVLRDVLTD